MKALRTVHRTCSTACSSIKQTAESNSKTHLYCLHQHNAHVCHPVAEHCKQFMHPVHVTPAGYQQMPFPDALNYQATQLATSGHADCIRPRNAVHKPLLQNQQPSEAKPCSLLHKKTSSVHSVVPSVVCAAVVSTSKHLCVSALTAVLLVLCINPLRTRQRQSVTSTSNVSWPGRSCLLLQHTWQQICKQVLDASTVGRSCYAPSLSSIGGEQYTKTAGTKAHDDQRLLHARSRLLHVTQFSQKVSDTTNQDAIAALCSSTDIMRVRQGCRHVLVNARHQSSVRLSRVVSLGLSSFVNTLQLAGASCGCRTTIYMSVEHSCGAPMHISSCSIIANTQYLR